MKIKKLLPVMLTVALVAVIGVGATLAYFTDKDDATNVITMGKVDIDLTEKDTEGVSELTEEGLKFDNVVPGDALPKAPKVTLANDSEDAYVRMIVKFEGLNADQINDLLVAKDNETPANIVINDGWKLVESKDENGVVTYCYYYNTKLTAGQSVTLFETVNIPAVWGNEIAGGEFKILVGAEAVQADNFETELVKDEAGNIIGWGDVAIAVYPVVTDAE